METSEIIGSEIADVCHENSHVEIISYYCKNHDEFLCDCCKKKGKIGPFHFPLNFFIAIDDNSFFFFNNSSIKFEITKFISIINLFILFFICSYIFFNLSFFSSIIFENFSKFFIFSCI